MDFVFLHVGSEQTPLGLVASIHKLMPRSNVIQISDHDTKPLKGIDQFISISKDCDIMLFRLKAFSSYKPQKMTVYLDTDMLLIQALNENEMIENQDVSLCKRQFDLHSLFNSEYGGMNMKEHFGKTLNEVYPFIACCTVTHSNEFWKACQNNLEGIDAKYQKWYGDQEAMRNVIYSGKYNYRELPESIYACLPEHALSFQTPPKLLHFKGLHRKPRLKELAKNLYNVAI